MKNLTEIALKNKSLVWYFIAVMAIGGILSYFTLGRMEDPKFTIREMVVTAYWPGATAEEMSEQVTDKIERKLQDVAGRDYIISETRPGETIIYFDLKDEVDNAIIRQTWHDVRNFCEGMKDELPEGVVGPFYDDTFDEIYGSIYALTGDGYSYEELRQEAEKIRRELLAVEDVKKIELVGVQTEKVYIRFDRAKLAQLGLSPTEISSAIDEQNKLTSAGMIDTASDDVYMRVTGQFEKIEDIKNLPLNAQGRIIRLGDIATVERTFVEPPEPKMFFEGTPAIGIAVAMEDGGNILDLGENLKEKLDDLQSRLPLGLEIHQVSDQPEVVDESIGEFVETLFLAIIIVLAVSFASLGLRTGMVVAGCIPLVLAGTFCFMYVSGIDLHKVSLGSLIIALGLLVDDAIIAVEMMSVQLERGFSKFEAACHAFKVTAKPMLTGTLITCAGFIPVAFAKGMASEFCKDMFYVVGAALLLSWITSVTIAPLFGTKIIKIKEGEVKDPYAGKFYAIFRSVLEKILAYKKLALAGTAGIFALSIMAMDFVSEEFFPPSLRPEILVDMRLPEESSLAATQAEADRLAKFLDGMKDELKNYTYYVGTPTPRFVLTVDPAADSNNYAQFVIVAKEKDIRDEVTEKIRTELDENFPLVKNNIRFIQTGPPADYPIMIRISGNDADEAKSLAAQVANIAEADGNAYNIGFDWFEKSKVVKIEVDKDKISTLGLSAETVKNLVYTELNGAKVSEFYTGDRTIDIEMRLAAKDANNLNEIKNLPIYLGAAGYVPLEQIAKISFAMENELICRRDLKPTITLQADIKSGTGNDTAQRILDATADLQKNMPVGAKIEAGGDLEDSGDSTDDLVEMLPTVLFVIMTLLMLQLHSAKDMFLTLLTAPLGIIGVIFALIVVGKPLGFVAELGVIALSGMIIRNSVILIDQIQQHLAAGENLHDAIIDSAVLRFRPIMLTAAAAILGMLPLMTSVFWGPMAVAIAGGLIVATVLTLLVLPAMYAATHSEAKN